MNFNWELGRLLCFIGRVATAIRMNSIYNGEYSYMDPRQVGTDVMWLADALHGFERLGQALQGGNLQSIEDACNGLLVSYEMYGHTDTGYKSEPAPTFWRQTLFTLEEGRSILTQIRDKASAFRQEHE